MTLSQELSRSARSILDQLGDSVVAIGRDGRGTGIVIAAGKVLTNAHNLHDRSTSVTFADGRSVQGTIAGTDGDGDLVVLDVDTADTRSAAWSDQAPTAGDVVFALSRGGQQLRISFGMVTSADLSFHGPRGRKVSGGVEHSAPLARGSSGGPLVDAEGRLVGVNTHRTGRNFYIALPAGAALQRRIEDLAAGRSVARPQLGVALAPPAVAAKLRRSVGLPERDGLLVREVQDNSPASLGGIAQGDLLVAVGETQLLSIDALYDALVGVTDAVSITVVRGTEERVVTVSFSADQPA